VRGMAKLMAERHILKSRLRYIFLANLPCGQQPSAASNFPAPIPSRLCNVVMQMIAW